MKRVLLLVTIICALTACKKTGITPGLFGKWELRRTYGGFSYSDSSYKAGNGHIFQFSRDSTYKQFSNNTVTAQGKFHIVKLVYGGSTSSGIAFDNSENPEPFTFGGTTFTLGTTLADGIASDYQKISN
ncbi:MAG: hypothetical protein ACXVIY_11010 [Mucilaginibacter sp.]